MLTAILAGAILSGQAVEPLDLQLGWQVGDKLTYTVTVKIAGFLTVNDSGTTTLTVSKANDKKVTVSASGTVFANGFGSLSPSTHEMTRRGRVTTNFRPENIAQHLMAMLLPDKPVDVGAQFTAQLISNEGTVRLTGKVAKLEGEDQSLAVIEMDGRMGPAGRSLAVAIRSTFHLKRQIFIKTSFRIYDDSGGNFSSELAMSLKEKAGDR